MNRSTPGLPVHQKLLEFAHTHAHWVSDAIQPSHPLLSLSPPAPNSSQHHSLFQRVNSLHEVAKILEFQLQYQFFQWTPIGPLMDRNLVVLRIRERERLTSPGFRGKPTEPCSQGSRCCTEAPGALSSGWRRSEPSWEGLRSPGKKVSSAGLCAPRD